MPEVALGKWLAFAKPLATSESKVRGIMSVLDERGYILGLCRYRIERGPAQRRTLIADHVIVHDLLDRNEPAAALVNAVEALAQELGCASVSIDVPQIGMATVESPLVGLLCNFGYQQKTYQMYKPMGEARAIAQ